MADYADIAEAKRRLDITGTSQDATLAALNAALSRTFEQKLGSRTFADEPIADVEKVVYGDGRWYTTLLLPQGLRSLTSIVEGAEWNGSDWAGGTTLAASEYRVLFGENGLALQIERVTGGTWVGPYLVTGQWADQPDGTIPADVVEAVTVLVVGTFRRDRTQDGEVSGPEGFSFRPSDPWKDPRVVTALQRYSVARVAV